MDTMFLPMVFAVMLIFNTIASLRLGRKWEREDREKRKREREEREKRKWEERLGGLYGAEWTHSNSVLYRRKGVA